MPTQIKYRITKRYVQMTVPFLGSEEASKAFYYDLIAAFGSDANLYFDTYEAVYDQLDESAVRDEARDLLRDHRQFALEGFDGKTFRPDFHIKSGAFYVFRKDVRFTDYLMTDTTGHKALDQLFEQGLLHAIIYIQFDQFSDVLINRADFAGVKPMLLELQQQGVDFSRAQKMRFPQTLDTL